MSEMVWTAPGPGFWELDRSHGYGGVTPMVQAISHQSIKDGLGAVFARWGIPAAYLDVRYVNGHYYQRLRPLMAPDKPAAKAPPAAVLKLAFKLHPELRRRAKRAAATLADQPWRQVVRSWDTTLRPAIEAKNLALQDVDLVGLDDTALAAHFERLHAHALEHWTLHFDLHASDLGPIGLLLVRCREWGIGARQVVPALVGASPSSGEPARALARLRGLVATTGSRPTSLEELRAASPEIAAELDRYLRYRGNAMVSRYDLDGRTLAEMPDVVLTTVLEGSDLGAGADQARADAAASAAKDVRARVPEGERATFDGLLREARGAMDLRDSNGPTTAEWPLGLLRLALLEIGRRLTMRERLSDPAQALELRHDEVAPLLLWDEGPTAGELIDRARRRAAEAAAVPPPSLGQPEVAPPMSAVPAAVATLIDVVQTVMTELATKTTPSPLHGTGVGRQPYRGRVRRADSPEEAIATLEPGDVLVVPYTTPVYNVILPLAGAIVTSEGGPLSHAAVLARELDLPAVVGASGALALLRDGDEVEVDPVVGEVRPVRSALAAH